MKEKAILININPYYCEKIENGEKTVEVRKIRPKISTPFKCYIYKTKGKLKDDDNSKVIGEFVCDNIQWEHLRYLTVREDMENTLRGTCLSKTDLLQYLKYPKGTDLSGNCKKWEFYIWHISDLKIYEKPKELREFKKAGYMTESDWLYALYPNTHCHYEAFAKKFELTRPPQSWCYVENLGD